MATKIRRDIDRRRRWNRAEVQEIARELTFRIGLRVWLLTAAAFGLGVLAAIAANILME